MDLDADAPVEDRVTDPSYRRDPTVPSLLQAHVAFGPPPVLARSIMGGRRDGARPGFRIDAGAVPHRYMRSIGRHDEAGDLSGALGRIPNRRSHCPASH